VSDLNPYIVAREDFTSKNQLQENTILGYAVETCDQK